MADLEDFVFWTRSLPSFCPSRYFLSLQSRDDEELVDFFPRFLPLLVIQGDYVVKSMYEVKSYSSRRIRARGLFRLFVLLFVIF